ncbi:MAG TPA: YfiR family protein [Polyangiaceae bacterium]
MSKPAELSRRLDVRLALRVLFACALVVLSSRSSSAQSDIVPVHVQAELFAKLANYDRNFAKRAGPKARVLIVQVPRNAESSLFASAMSSALGRIDRIAGLPLAVAVVTYTGAAALAKACQGENVAAVYLGPGLDGEMARVRAALTGVNVISVAARREYVPLGAVLGFELASGKPRVLVNLPQARKQDVDFRADVLKLMRVYR